MKKGDSIFCFIGGDQTHDWVQRINVFYTSIPIQDARLMFEIQNRQFKQYLEETDVFGYAGLDNLQEEIVYMRNKRLNEKVASLSYDQIKKSFSSLLEVFDYFIDNEPQRYGNLKKYLTKYDRNEYKNYTFEDIICDYSINEDKYYWIEQQRVDENTYSCYSDGYGHWYNVVELFDELPVDFSDENVVSVFCTEKAIEFLDLSYGC